MTLTIIGIHGLANKPKKETLANWWQQSVDEGLKKNQAITNPNYEFEMVFWADLLYKNLQHNDTDFDFDSLFNEEPYREAASGFPKPYDDNILDEVRRIGFDLFGGVVDRVKEATDTDILAHWVLARSLKDLAFYYDPERLIRDRQGTLRMARQVLMQELQSAITKHKHKPLMIVAHSMGSIIAYDVLRDMGQVDETAVVDHFVTIGSPLGLPLVKTNVFKERQHYAGKTALRTPTIVAKSWINFADRKDPVAFDTHLSDDYKPNKEGIGVKDDLVTNDYSNKGTRNHHKSYGYLRTPELSKHIADCL